MCLEFTDAGFRGSGVRLEMKWTSVAAAGGILALGVAGWWIGTSGRSPDAEAAAVATAPEVPAIPPVVADLKKEWSTASNPNPQAAGT